MNLPSDFTITCHAGALGTKANTVDSVRTAVKWGAQIVEFDVTFRPSGLPVIIHSGSPSESEGELLSEALAAVAESDTCRINLDIKSTANLSEADRLVAEAGLTDRVFYTGVGEEWVETVRKNSAIPYYLNHRITLKEALSKKAAEQLAARAKSLGAIGINSHFSTATHGYVKTIHRCGLLVSLWTVDSPSQMRRVLKLAPDNITTRQPEALKSLVGSIK